MNLKRGGGKWSKCTIYIPVIRIWRTWAHGSPVSSYSELTSPPPPPPRVRGEAVMPATVPSSASLADSTIASVRLVSPDSDWSIISVAIVDWLMSVRLKAEELLSMMGRPSWLGHISPVRSRTPLIPSAILMWKPINIRLHYSPPSFLTIRKSLNAKRTATLAITLLSR